MKIVLTVNGEEFNPKNFTEKIKKQVIENFVEIIRNRIIKNVDQCKEHPDQKLQISIDVPSLAEANNLYSWKINYHNICCDNIRDKIKNLNDD